MRNIRVVRVLVGLGGLTVVGYNTLPHVFPRQIIEPMCAVPQLTPIERHNRLLKEVCTQMDVEQNKIHLFYNNGFSTVSGGCLSLPGGGVIGISRNTTYTCRGDVNNAGIAFQSKNISNNSLLGQAFQDFLLFDDEQIKFLLAHELGHIKHVHYCYRTLHAVTFYIATIFSSMVGTLMLKRKLYVTAFQILTMLVGITSFRYTQRRLNHWIEFEADESAGKLGFDYCLGGIEYLEQKMKLNAIMRTMYGEKIKERYSPEGNSLQISHPKEADRLEKLRQIQMKLM